MRVSLIVITISSLCILSSLAAWSCPRKCGRKCARQDLDCKVKNKKKPVKKNCANTKCIKSKAECNENEVD